ncbi:MAG: Asp-tRNA(Asn)/Glu-tRNA(Gln) amidotransferase subunit GatB [Candidatus Omnitrophica bacterium]|nr:Asp-tRNA(Asn)/Glu-tRNA(Gln) amidotransferase subunit GatB [Candidatus Omnitrophota bacterium]
MEYETVIGLEVHAQLKTNTKAFCGCRNEFGLEPNSSVCPVCLGFPGSLPVLNKRAFELAIKTALALGCRIQPLTKFDRKNYFYPDLPKNFQISQYDMPLSLNGFLQIEEEGYKKRIGIKRIHLEEDAGKLMHEENNSLVDFNRAGTPLMEIVSEPDMSSPQEAYDYLTALKLILQYLEVSECSMEKGTLRCDANISLREKGAKALGVKAELKNLNSFKAVKAALEYEEIRQRAALEAGGKIIQETRLWNDASLKTVPMRSKEEAQDYRYFPEPDLISFTIGEKEVEGIRKTIPELPLKRRQRFSDDYGLSRYDAGVLISDRLLADYFEGCLKIRNAPKPIANWLNGPVMSFMNERGASIAELGIRQGDLIDLIALVEDGTINNLTAKDVLREMLQTKSSPRDIIKQKDLAQISDSGELSGLIEEAVRENEKTVADYKAGKVSALMFLVGQVMRKSKGKANPNLLQDMIKRRLS